LQWAVDHKTAKAILISGGGYGTLRVIDKVNFKPLSKNPKWVIGYSDTTVLHSRLVHLKIAAIHGTMAFQFLKNEEATLSVKQLLFGQKVNYKIDYNTLNRMGVAEAEIVGGNLSLLYALSGSVDDISAKNKILFLEDLDEQLYHVDRMILQLKRSGKLKHLKGLIVGGMSDMKDNAIPFGKTAEEIVLDAVKEYNYPVCFNFPAGHIEKNMALYLGKKARLRITKNKVSLEYIK
jgi:muramoyltetrapeptide carboxypeptidase